MFGVRRRFLHFATACSLALIGVRSGLAQSPDLGYDFNPYLNIQPVGRQ